MARQRPKNKLLIVLLALFGAVAGLGVPFAQKSLIDRISLGAPTDLMALGALAITAFSLMVLSRSLLTLVRLLGLREGSLVVRWLSSQLYIHTLNLHPHVRRNKTTGELTALYTSHIQNISFFFEEIMPLTATALLPVLLAPFAVHAMVGIPIYPVIFTLFAAIGMSFFLANRQSRLFAIDKKTDEIRIAMIHEWLVNIRTLRLLGWTNAVEKSIFLARKNSSEQRIRVVRNGTFMNSISFIAPAAINCAGIWALVINNPNQITPGSLFGIIWTLGVFLVTPIRMLPWAIVIYLDAKSSLDRITDVLRLPVEEPDTKVTSTEPNISATRPLPIDVRGLNLTIDGKHLLKDVSLRVDAGELLVIVGEVGAGKSLLLQALTRDLHATFEYYRIGQWDASEISLQQLRGLFATVPQEPFAMSATVGQNIAFHFAAADNHILLHESLAATDLNADLQHWPDGLATELGERGVNLSGGQRQRLTLARAVYANRSIILLDDTFSALDRDTEIFIFKELICGKWHQKTRILVTHRFAQLQADWNVVFLAGGRVAAYGKFSDLKNTNREFSHFIENKGESR